MQEWTAPYDHVQSCCRAREIPGHVTHLGGGACRVDETGAVMPWGPRHPMPTEEAWHMGSCPLFPGKARHMPPLPIWLAATINVSTKVHILVLVHHQDLTGPPVPQLPSVSTLHCLLSINTLYYSTLVCWKGVVESWNKTEVKFSLFLHKHLEH